MGIIQAIRRNKLKWHPDGRRLVFRFEHATAPGEGPCNEGPYVKQGQGLALFVLGAGAAHCGDPVHPSPEEDAGLRDWWLSCWRGDWLFGFRDMDQLTNWFMYPDKMAEVAAVGRIGVYAVPPSKIIDGQFQSCFIPDAAELVAVLPTTAMEYKP